MSDSVQAQNLSLSQESELNATAASQESFEHKMAFETYYKLGESRSFAKTAKQIGRAVRTIEDWAAKYRWTPRVRERERQAAEFLLMQKSAEEEAKTKEKHLTLIDASISQWSKNLLEGGIKLKTVEDVEKLIRLRWDIAGMQSKRVNPGAMSQGGGMIDLRLRNMDREELQKFLHGTLSSISRIMNKKPRSATELAEPKSTEKINMDLRISMDDTNNQDLEPKMLDVGAAPIEESDLIPEEISDFNFDLDIDDDNK